MVRWSCHLLALLGHFSCSNRYQYHWYFSAENNYYLWFSQRCIMVYCSRFTRGDCITAYDVIYLEILQSWIDQFHQCSYLRKKFFYLSKSKEYNADTIVSSILCAAAATSSMFIMAQREGFRSFYLWVQKTIPGCDPCRHRRDDWLCDL